MFGRVIQMMVTLWSRGRCCVPLLIDLTDTAWVLCLQPIMEPCLPVSYSRPNQSPSRPFQCISLTTLFLLSPCLHLLCGAQVICIPIKTAYKINVLLHFIVNSIIINEQFSYSGPCRIWFNELVDLPNEIFIFERSCYCLGRMKMQGSVLCIYLFPAAEGYSFWWALKCFSLVPFNEITYLHFIFLGNDIKHIVRTVDFCRNRTNRCAFCLMPMSRDYTAHMGVVW